MTTHGCGAGEDEEAIKVRIKIEKWDEAGGKCPATLTKIYV
jgi:hypothetical protein